MELFLEKSDQTYDYSCLMWRCPQFYKDLIVAWGKKNIPDENLFIDPEDAGSSGREDDTHVTVKYGIHTKDPQDIQNLVSGFGTFLVEFGKVSKFEKQGKYDVIKIAVNGKKLRELNAKVSAELECTDTYKEYNPHVTIAYVKPGTCDHLLDKDMFQDLRVKATELIFSIAGVDNKVTIALQ